MRLGWFLRLCLWLAQPERRWASERSPLSAHLSFAVESRQRLSRAQRKTKPGFSQSQSSVGRTSIVMGGKRYGEDCTGLVRAVYAQIGIELMGQGRAGDNGVTAIWRFASSRGQAYTGGRPVPGDLVFFKETYDLNRDGRDNDGLTHIGIVEYVGDDQTVTVIHRIKKGVVRYRMNLNEPDKTVDAAGRLINDKLRPPRAKAKAMLTSQLFASYVNLLPVEPTLISSREP
jgi:peptidoglycan DL-endopeptidase CwlO